MAQSRFSGESAGELTSIAAMAAAAEELAAGSEAATLPERDLEPPAWVTGEPDETPEPEPESESRPEPEPEPGAVEPAGESNGTISLSSAEFDDLRGLGMSVTQAKRVLRYREQRGGFTDFDELERVPGFPRVFLAYISDRVVP